MGVQTAFTASSEFQISQLRAVQFRFKHHRHPARESNDLQTSFDSTWMKGASRLMLLTPSDPSLFHGPKAQGEHLGCCVVLLELKGSTVEIAHDDVLLRIRQADHGHALAYISLSGVETSEDDELLQRWTGFEDTCHDDFVDACDE